MSTKLVRSPLTSGTSAILLVVAIAVLLFTAFYFAKSFSETPQEHRTEAEESDKSTTRVSMSVTAAVALVLVVFAIFLARLPTLETYVLESDSE